MKGRPRQRKDRALAPLPSPGPPFPADSSLPHQGLALCLGPCFTSHFLSGSFVSSSCSCLLYGALRAQPRLSSSSLLPTSPPTFHSSPLLPSSVLPRGNLFLSQGLCICCSLSGFDVHSLLTLSNLHFHSRFIHSFIHSQLHMLLDLQWGYILINPS